MIKELPGNKATVSNDIPISVVKKSVSAYYEKLTDTSNNCIKRGTFPEILKKDEVTPSFQKRWSHIKNRLSPSKYSIKSFKNFWETHLLAIK